MKFKRAVFIVLDSVGVGALPDAAKFGDSLKYNTLGNIAKKMGGLKLPNLESLGLGKLTNIKGMPAKNHPHAIAFKSKEQSRGKDTSTGHWEFGGFVSTKAPVTYPEGFPPEFIERFIKENNLSGILGNYPSSGTEILDKLGEEHMRTGLPIVYTSADSVFQIACHEETFGLQRLYELCESARRICDDYQVTRVIARPFVGPRAGEFKRTPNRKDYSIEIPEKLIFSYLQDMGIQTHSIGKIANIFNHQGISSNVPSKNNADGIAKLIQSLKEIKEGVIMINLVDFDQNFGHRRDVAGYAKCLEEFDAALPEIMNEIGINDLLVLTADHGTDPTAHGTDHTREHVPFILYSPRILNDAKNNKPECLLTFADIGASIFDALTGEAMPKKLKGKSVLKKIKMEEVQDESLFTPYKIIEKKRDGQKLTRQEIRWFIDGLTKQTIADYQMTALLMASYINGLGTEETAALTDAMLYSGQVLEFNDPLVIDKHSTGGIGDKTSFILAPIAAAAGVRVPMIAGRGLGHTGGTVDKIEAIAGYKTELTLDDFKRLLYENNLVLIGQTKDIAPADKKIYALRDVTATVDSIPLITASIMSKKLAEGMAGLVMDVKVGSGAFMKTKPKAKALAKSIMETGARFNKNTMVLITEMSQPLGNMVGNSLEIIESIDTIKGKGPKDLTELSCELAGGMIYLAGLAKTHKDGIKKAYDVIKNGKALEKFRQMIAAQGGDTSVVDDYSKLPVAKCQLQVKAPKKGFIKSFENEKIGLLCLDLGGGRKVAGAPIDFGVGFDFHKKVGDPVKEGEAILTIYYNENQQELAQKVEQAFLNEVISFSTTKVAKLPLIHERMSKWSKK